MLGMMRPLVLKIHSPSAQAPSNEVPPRSGTKAPIRRTSGGGRAAVGNLGNAAFVAHRCLFFVLASGREVTLQVKATQLFHPYLCPCLCGLAQN